MNQGNVYPLVILVLSLAWLLFFVSLSALLPAQLAHRKNADGESGKWLLATVFSVFVVALVGARLVSPGPPVLCTFTGLSHITSAYRIADLAWGWPFPSDYPLTVPTLAALFVQFIGPVPEAFGWASSLLHALGAAGCALLVATLFRSRWLPLLVGLAAALSPALLLFARGDSLSIGYYGLSPWVVLSGIALLRADRSLPRACAGLALGTSLALVMQTRLEALAFPAVILLLPAVISGPLSPRQGLLRLLRVLGLVLLALVPVLTVTVQEVLSPARLGTELGVHVAWKVLLAVGFVAAGILLMGHTRPARRPPLWLPLALFGLVLAGWCGLYGIDLFLPRTHCFGMDCAGQSYRTVWWWHLSPKLFSVGVIFLALLGLFHFAQPRESRRVAWLVLWAGGMVAAASLKMTGELPFEGLRTQVPATVPLLLLAAAGWQRLARHSRSLRMGAALLVVVGWLTPALVLGQFGYDEQAEFSFLRQVAPKLSEKAFLFAPDDVLEVTLPGDAHATPVDLYHLYRSAYMTEALGREGRSIRVLPAGALAQQDLEDGRPRYWFANLNCTRTGQSEEVTPSCARTPAEYELRPVATQEVASRPYTSDYYPQTRVSASPAVLGIYEILARRPEGGVNAVLGDRQSE